MASNRTSPLSRADAVAAYRAQRDHARATLEAAGVGPSQADALIALGRDVIAIEARNALVADKKPGATRLAGLPDLPHGGAWPSREGYVFHFVAQLRLEELAALDIHELLPHEGVLSFFAGHDVTPRSEWQLAFRVEHHAPDVPLAPCIGDTATRPRHLRQPKPSGLDFRPVFHLPPPWASWLPEVTRSRAYEDAYESLYQLTADPVHPMSGLLGFGRARELDLAADERMLLRLDAGERIPYEFVESVNLCFVLRDDALARFDLAAVRAYEGAQI